MRSPGKSFQTRRDQVIAENPIVDFLREQGVELQPSGANFVTSSCPRTKHKPNHRPVSVDVGKKVWHCNDCEIGGSVIEWMMHQRNVPFIRAMAILSGKNGRHSSLVATYDYTDESGKLLFQSCRFVPKDFRQRRPDGAGGWIWNLNGVRRVVYHLPEVVTASTVAVCEGEKDCDNLRKLGVIATCNPGGAGNWRDDYSESLRGKDTLLFPDGDEKGAAHVEQVAKSLHGIAKSIHRITLPAGFKDVSEFLAPLTDDDARTAIARLIAEATPVNFRTIQVVSNDSQQNGEEEFDDVVVDNFPEPMSDVAFHGLARDIVRRIEPHSEASPVALVIQILTAFGNIIGRGAWAVADGCVHGTNLNSVLVGETSKARKGTSWQHTLRLFKEVDPRWAKNRIADGLSTGEGLIWQVRDPIQQNVRDKKTGQYEQQVVDEGVLDKRLFVVEGEFANVLKVMARAGNTLSGVVRNAWDSGNLRSLTKNSPSFATDTLISIHGHITLDELRKLLTETEAGNGFGNRFIFLAVRRSRILPEGGNLPTADFSDLIERLTSAIEFARNAGEISRDDSARELWCACYEGLSEGKPGLLGAVTARAEAQVLRLSVLVALLDRSRKITAEHHRAAMGIWDYAERSARWVFATATGNANADRIRLALQAVGDAGMTQSEVSTRVFNRNIPAQQLRDAFRVLYGSGQARFTKELTGGAPLTRWFAT
jgi:hypothetical protein